MARIAVIAKAVLRHPEIAFSRLFGRAKRFGAVEVECAGPPGAQDATSASRQDGEPAGLMARDTFSVVARRVLPYCDAVIFSGRGEPLLNGDLPWMIGVVKSFGRTAHVRTDGLLLDEEKICEFIGAGVDSITVTLRGAAAGIHDAVRGAGNFEKTVRNVDILEKVKRKMRREAPPLTLEMAVRAGNIGGVNSFIDLAGGLGAFAVAISHAGIREEEQGDWKKRADSHGLRLWLRGGRAGPDDLAISWNGDVGPRRSPFREDREPTDAPCFGNILETRLAVIRRGIGAGGGGKK